MPVSATDRACCRGCAQSLEYSDSFRQLRQAGFSLQRSAAVREHAAELQHTSIAVQQVPASWRLSPLLAASARAADYASASKQLLLNTQHSSPGCLLPSTLQAAARPLICMPCCVSCPRSAGPGSFGPMHGCSCAPGCSQLRLLQAAARTHGRGSRSHVRWGSCSVHAWQTALPGSRCLTAPRPPRPPTHSGSYRVSPAVLSEMAAGYQIIAAQEVVCREQQFVTCPHLSSHPLVMQVLHHATLLTGRQLADHNEDCWLRLTCMPAGSGLSLRLSATLVPDTEKMHVPVRICN